MSSFATKYLDFSRFVVLIFATKYLDLSRFVVLIFTNFLSWFHTHHLYETITKLEPSSSYHLCRPVIHTSPKFQGCIILYAHTGTKTINMINILCAHEWSNLTLVWATIADLISCIIIKKSRGGHQYGIYIIYIHK